jgi:tetratricopeptide (TPR) repeat protein
MRRSFHAISFHLPAIDFIPGVGNRFEMDQREYRVFISSPSDVWAERERLFRVITRLAGEVGSIKLTPFRWEESYYSAAKTFQDQIPPPSQSDLVICIFWKRLGSELPPEYRRPDGSLPTGSEYEFEEAIKAARERGTPDVLVYRKTASVLFQAEQLALETTQFTALQEFWKRWFQTETGHFTAGYHSFSSTDDFETQVEAHVRQWLERLHAFGEAGTTWSVTSKGSPFKGLEPFDESHSAVFFGRQRVVELLRERMIDAATRATPFLVLLGMSGAGKSSLVRAGLVPRLTQPGAVPDVDLWRRCVIRPSEGEQQPISALARALYRADVLPELASGDSATPEDFDTLLRTAPDAGAKAVGRALDRSAQAIARQEGFERPLKAKVLLVIDQLEELFALPKEAIAGFVAALTSLLTSGAAWIVCTMRSDQYATLQTVAGLVALKEKGVAFDLLPPSAAEIEEIVAGPARAAGLQYERRTDTGTGLDQELARAALAPGSLPFLQFTLDELFNARDEATGTLTVAAYDRLGGLAGAIERRAEATFVALDEEAQAELPAVVRQLVTFTREDAATARAAPREQLMNPPARGRLVEAFVAARLLAADVSGGRPLIRIAHEALGRSWSRVAALIAADRDFLRTRARVESSAHQWEEEEGDSEFLLPPGRPLAEAAEILATRRDALGDNVVAFIEASAAADTERQQAERYRREEQLRTEAAAAYRLARRTRIAAAVISVFLVAALVAFSFAMLERSRARQQSVEAQKNFTAALATATKLVNEVRVNFAARNLSAKMARDILITAEGALGQLSEVRSVPEIVHQQINLLMASSDTLRALGDSRQALRRAEDAERLARELVAATPDDPESLRELTGSLTAHGDGLMVLGDPAAALGLFREALAIGETLAGKDATVATQGKLALGHRKVAEALRDRGLVEEALTEFRASLLINERLAAGDPVNSTLQRAVSIDQERIGTLLKDQGDIEGASAAFHVDLAINERFAALNPDDAGWRRNVAVVHEKLGYVLIAKNDPAGALGEFRIFMQTMQQIASRDPSNTGSLRDLADAHDDIANALMLLADVDGAEPEYRAGLAIRNDLVAKDADNARWQSDLALSREKLGDVALARNDTDGALKWYRTALPVRTELVAKDTGNTGRQRNLAVGHAKIAAVLIKRGEPGNGRAEYQIAVNILEQLMARQPDNAALRRELQAGRDAIASVEKDGAPVR